MILFLLLMNLTMTLTFMFMIHPLSTGVILLIQTSIISLITGNMNINFWFSYIIFLIMVGSLMVLFLYMTSIASNEKFKMNQKLMLIMPMSLFMLLIMPYNMNFNNKEFLMKQKNNTLNMILNKFMSLPSMMILIFIILYLLICLIAVIKIINLNYGPLRKKN